MTFFETFDNTEFLKSDSTLQNKYDALIKLNEEYPNRKELLEELYIVRQGLYGEREIDYQLNKSNLGLYVLKDINIEYGEFKAQIDYVVISKMFIYFIECKNLIGNITVNENGNFIREYTFDKQKYQKGIYSPLRQVEAQRDVFKKIWNINLSKNKIINNIKRRIFDKNFTYYHRVLVVCANRKTILNMEYAPQDIKDKVIKSDMLVKRIEQDLNNSDKSLWSTKNEMKREGYFFFENNINTNINYYSYYKNKWFNNDISDREFSKKLVSFRKNRAMEMNVPAYYVFTNDELNKLVSLRPKTLGELNNILPSIKVKVHGEKIIDYINSI